MRCTRGAARVTIPSSGSGMTHASPRGRAAASGSTMSSFGPTTVVGDFPTIMGNSERSAGGKFAITQSRTGGQGTGGPSRTDSMARPPEVAPRSSSTKSSSQWSITAARGSGPILPPEIASTSKNSSPTRIAARPSAFTNRTNSATYPGVHWRRTMADLPDGHRVVNVHARAVRLGGGERANGGRS